MFLLGFCAQAGKDRPKESARLSTQDHNLNLQIDSLKNADCEMIFEERISGKPKDRPELFKSFSKLCVGDTLIVWKLGRLGRSLKDLIDRLSIPPFYHNRFIVTFFMVY